MPRVVKAIEIIDRIETHRTGVLHVLCWSVVALLMHDRREEGQEKNRTAGRVSV